MRKNDTPADSIRQDQDGSKILDSSETEVNSGVSASPEGLICYPAKANTGSIGEDAKKAGTHLPGRPVKRTWLDSLSAVFEAIPGITKSLAIVLFILLFSLVTYKEIIKDAVVIEPFEVPKSLESQGLTGQAIANKFIDQIHFIWRRASTTMQSLQFTASWMETEPEIHVPQGGEFMESILTNIRNYFGDDTIRITGEVVLHNDRLYITTRISGKPAKTVSGQLDDLTAVLLQSAEHIYHQAQPYILASYLYDIDRERSIEIIYDALRRPPPDDDAWAYNLWGLILFDRQDYAGAIAKYQKAIGTKATDVGAHVHAYNNWGLALKAQGDYAAAIAKYQKAVDLDPTHVQAYNGWGRALEAQGNYAGAIDRYREAIAANPKDDNAYFNWGTVLLVQNDYPGAIAKYQQVIDLNPDAVLAYNNLGWALEAQGRYEEAIDKYRTAIAVDPKDHNAYFNWGTALLIQNDNAGAIDQYKKTVELAPGYVQAYNYWGRALEKQGDYNGAIEKYRKAVDLDPKNADGYLNWGNALMEKHNYKEAAALFQEAITLDPNNTGANYNLGLALAQLENYDEATAAFQRVIELDQDSDIAREAAKTIEVLKKNRK